MNKKLNYGYIEPRILPTDYIFGDQKLSAEVLQDNGQWDAASIINENQNVNQIETYNCTSFATTTAYEEVIYRKYREIYNFSDRGLGIMAGTQPPGNDPNTVAEAARHLGLFPEELLPFDESVADTQSYFLPNPLSDKMTLSAKGFLQHFSIGHDWVFTNGHNNAERKERLMEALKYSPLGVSVYAWEQNENGLYVNRNGLPDCHWTNMIGYVKDQFWIIKDSYPTYEKHLEWDFPFGWAMRFSATRLPLASVLTPAMAKVGWIKKYLQEILCQKYQFA